MLVKICAMYDKFCAVFLFVKSKDENTLFELKRFDDLEQAILFYNKNKELIKIPEFNTLKRLGVLDEHSKS